MKLVVTLGLLSLLARAADAHHSFTAVYDLAKIVEAEGVITEVAWANPHVRFKMRGTEAGGRERVWELESNSVSIVSRFGLSADVVAAGTSVRVAGFAGRQRDDVMFLRNMLLPSDQEILFGANIVPRWSQRTIGTDIRTAVAADASGKLGIFRVWTNVTGPGAFWGNTLPLTPTAAAAHAVHDPLNDDPTANCAPKGMPYVMEQPYPVELVEDGDTILLKLEEYDTVRRIAMSGSGVRREPRLGISTGRWDGKTLVVSTTGVDYGYLNSTGIPMPRDAQFEEQFTLSADGSRLDYALTITAPATFTEPVTFRKSWEWRPGEQVRPYDCKK